jgi:hypothetical protein
MGVSEEKEILTAKECEEGERLDGFVFVTIRIYQTSSEYQSSQTAWRVIPVQVLLA